MKSVRIAFLAALLFVFTGLAGAQGLELIGSINTPGDAHGVSVSGDYAYVADYYNGLHIVNISDPSSPIMAGHVDISGNSNDVHVVGNYAYVAEADNSYLFIVDVTNPANAFIVGSFGAQDRINSVYVDGDYAFLADGSAGLRIVDVSNPSVPTLIGYHDTPGSASGVYVLENYAYVCDHDYTLHIINISNLSNPVLEGSCNVSGLARKGVFVIDGYAYVGNWDTGLQIIDITTPSSPFLVGSYDTPGYAIDVLIMNNLAYVTDWDNGLQVIDISDPQEPIFESSYYTSGIARGIDGDGEYIYVVNHNSLLIFCALQTNRVIHIPGDYATIQEGIDVAYNGDTVLVADGIYTENINFLGKAIAVRSENGHEATTIEIQNTGIPVVTFNTNENTNSVLEGFTVNGDLSYWGVYCDHSSPFIYNNVIKNHECGIKVDFGSPIIRKNEISFCDHSEIEPHVGGGIQLMNSNDVVIDSNVIHNNWANVSGGIHTDGCSNVRVERNLIYSNDCVYVSGIKIDRGSNFVIINNTLVDNSASDRLGVILFWDSNDISIINNICAFNNEWGIYSWGSSYNIVVDFNDTYENSPGNINGIEPGPGSIYTNPMFVDIYNNNYQLTAGSPCINAGNPDSPLDPDGTIADIGALYFDISVSEFTLDIDEVLGEQGQPVEVPIFAYGLEAQEIAGRLRRLPELNCISAMM